MNVSKKLVAGLAAAAAIAAGSIAFAAIPDAGGVIHGCYDKSTGDLRVTDTQTGTPKGCSAKELGLNWNQQGLPGTSGYEIRSKPTAYDATDLKVAAISCPAGKAPLGGGVTATSNSVAIVLSAPDFLSGVAVGWHATVREVTPVSISWGATVYVICAKVS